MTRVNLVSDFLAPAALEHVKVTVSRHLLEGVQVLVAEQVTGVEATVLSKAAHTELAGSALYALQAAFGAHELYVELADQAALLVCRLAWNHPLPDGNKRVGWASLVMFLDLNGVRWDPDLLDLDDSEATMLTMAAGQVDRGPRALAGFEGCWPWPSGRSTKPSGRLTATPSGPPGATRRRHVQSRMLAMRVGAR